MLVCLECERDCKSLLSLKTHLRRAHEIKHKNYLLNHFYDNNPPVCACGCGQEVAYFRGKYRDYLQGHFLKTNREAIDSETAQEKRFKTNLERYGGISPASSLKVREKMRETNVRKYGGPTPSASAAVLSKTRKTNLKKYGVDSPLKNVSILDKVKKTNLERYGVDNPSKSAAVKEKIKRKNLLPFVEVQENCSTKGYIPLFYEFEYIGCREFLDFLCIKHNKTFKSSIFNIKNARGQNQCPDCRLSGTSIKEKEIGDFVEGLGFKIERNSYRVITPKELDIYIPSKNLAIEYHGLYWHSELSKYYSDNSLLFHKFNQCRALGIDLLQFFEDEWRDHEEICKSMIMSRLGIFEQEHKTKELTITEDEVISDFLAENDLQQACKNFKSFCLKSSTGEVVAAISLNKSSDKEYENAVEIVRFTTKKGTLIPDGFSSLFNSVKEWCIPAGFTTILNITDCRHDAGTIYRDSGFIHSGYIFPDDYTDGKGRHTTGTHKIHGAGHSRWVYNLR